MGVDAVVCAVAQSLKLLKAHPGGGGLPENLLPVAAHSVAMVGHVEMAALIASGAQHIFILADPRKEEEHLGLEVEINLVNHILGGLKESAGIRAELLSDTDPEILEQQ